MGSQNYGVSNYDSNGVAVVPLRSFFVSGSWRGEMPLDECTRQCHLSARAGDLSQGPGGRHRLHGLNGLVCISWWVFSPFRRANVKCDDCVCRVAIVPTCGCLVLCEDMSTLSVPLLA